MLGGPYILIRLLCYLVVACYSLVVLFTAQCTRNQPIAIQLIPFRILPSKLSAHHSPLVTAAHSNGAHVRRSNADGHPACQCQKPGPVSPVTTRNVATPGNVAKKTLREM